MHASTIILGLVGLASAQTLNIPSRVGNVVSLPSPSVIKGNVDLGNREYDRGRPCNSDKDTGSVSAVFVLENGASLSNVIIGPNQLEGIHCKGSCTLTNVWFRDVCEDAISILGSGNALIKGGGAQEAKDKVVQHNGVGTVTIDGFTVVNSGKLYRSCGNCTGNKSKSPRKVVVKNVKASNVATLVGINSNYGDQSEVSGTCGSGVKHVCEEFEGVDKSAKKESPKLSSTASCKGQTSLSSC
ncbi:Pectate lyase, catalytic [Penicillium italicum]|uniref:Pectate lyase n=1 Tax=Penicillium italicum TaxID=40296 RepID=A0A0A2LF10_PENIT|nr:Pectate lyase, catalytic [Penicillium italicum]